MIGGLITAGRFGYAAISGVDTFVDATAGYAVKLALRSSRIDSDAAERMVSAIRAAAPVLTGRLVNGIRAYQTDDGTWIVEASAIKESGGVTWDYAPFVEFGHGATAPEPFFYAVADPILEERGIHLADAPDDAAREAGF